jgi:hypothetical protein
MEEITSLDNLTIGNKYLVLCPKDRVGRLELILEYKGEQDDKLIFELFFSREFTRSKWTKIRGAYKPTSKPISKKLIFPDKITDKDKLYIIYSLGDGGRIITFNTSPRDIPTILLTVNRKLNELPSDLANNIKSFLGGRKTRRRKSTRRKTRRRKSTKSR